MQVKICGMREAANIWAVAGLSPDFIGLIFYEKSARFVGHTLDTELLRSLPASVRKVGVFVDAPLAELLATVARYSLDYVQLHGCETPAYCHEARQNGLRVIKAFLLDASFDFTVLPAYEPYCDLFLFDTKGAQPGGNGLAFDWQLLAKYHGTIPFLLAGGLGLDNADELLRFHHPQLVGYDFNSHLEIAPGLKDVDAACQLLTRLHEQAAT